MCVKRIVPMAILVGLGCLACFAASDAHAAAGAGLPVTNEFQMVADTAHGHLFISQGTAAGNGDDAILVTDLSGNPVTTIGGQSGVRGLTLSPDGSTLYAALTTGQAVSAISTTTLTVTATYPLPAGDAAYAVAVQSGRLWVSYHSSSSATSGIGEIDPGNVNSFTANAVPGFWTFAPAIATDPSDTGVLVTTTVNASPPVAATYDVSSPSAVTQTASETSFANCGGSPDALSVLPGGATFLCDGTPYSTATLAAQNSGVSFGGPTVVAPNGAMAVAPGSGSILVYAAGAATYSDDYDLWYGLRLPSSFPLNASSPVDFAWSADSKRLFAVIESTSTSANPIFSVLSLYPFQVVPPDFTLTSTATTVGYGGSATVTPRLGVTYANRSFSLYETVAGQARQLLFSGPADPSGSLTVSGSFTRDTTFTAVFTGDARYAAKTVAVRIAVGVKITTVLAGYYKSTRIAGTTYRVYHHTATLKDAVTVTPNKRGECVKLQVQVYSHNTWRPATSTPCTALSASSKAALALKLGTTGRFRARPEFLASAKDTFNVSTAGPWLYYLVTK